MRTRTKLGLLVACLAGAGALGAGLYVHHALAEGIPSPTALYYSGVLEEAGVPVDGERDITITLYPDALSTTPICTAASPTTVVTQGHFRISLPPSCTLAIHDHPNANLGVTVAGEALPTQPIGAVPYAIEADHAVTASSTPAADHATQADLATTAQTAQSLELTNGTNSLTFGVWVGTTTATTTGRITTTAADGSTVAGMSAARLMCNAEFAGSHMCTGPELSMSMQLGIEPDHARGTGWFAGDTGGFAPGDSPNSQCASWTDPNFGGVAAYGPLWTPLGTTASFLYRAACSTSTHIMCCR